MTSQRSFWFVFLMIIVVIAGINGFNFMGGSAEAKSVSGKLTISGTVLEKESQSLSLVISPEEIIAGASVDGDTGGVYSWFNVCKIFLISLTSTTSSCVNIEFFRRRTHLSQDCTYSALYVDGATEVWHSQVGTLYFDDDENAELHWRITNCGLVTTVVELSVSAIAY